MSWKMNRIAVVGSGAVGLYYGGRLAAAGEDVHFLARSDYAALCEHGIIAKSIDGDFRVTDPAVHPNTPDIGPVDLVIVAWKATSNRHLPILLRPLLNKDTRVLTLQNGLGNCEAIADIVGAERVLGGLCFVCINRVQPGQIRHTGGGRVSIGSWHKDSAKHAEEVTERFKAAGIRANLVEDLVKAQWEKLIWNIPFNGLSVAEGGITTDVLLDDSYKLKEIRALMMEVISTANAMGIQLEESLADQNIERTRPMGAYRTSSMIDYMEGRELEVGPIWEEPLKRAKAAGLQMPHLETLIKRIKERVH